MTTPEFPDGSIVLQAAQTPKGIFAATIGFEFATILYLGTAPGSVNGVMQVNLSIPSDTSSGPSVPVSLLSADGFRSRSGVTITVK